MASIHNLATVVDQKGARGALARGEEKGFARGKAKG
jgi:hypothetical protein